MEFLMMVGLAGVALLIFMGIAYSQFNTKIEESKRDKVREFGRYVQDEIILASEVHKGYSRTIELPDKISNDIQYSISLSGDNLVITYDEGDVLYRLPEVSGSISKGKVEIRNVDGNVQIA